jgi:cytochrome c-type biogenesis protein CcmH
MSEQERLALVRSMVERLAARLKDNPNDMEGWTRLGQSYRVLGEEEKARDAFARAEALKAGR